MSQDSWTIRKGKTRTSWVWKMINDHYGVRKKARKHGKWDMKQDSAAWKFRTQKFDDIIYSDFEDKFGALSIVHFIYTIYRFKTREVRSPMLQMVYKLEMKGRSYGHLKTTAPSWRVISKWFRNSTYGFEIQLMNSKSTSKWHQFRIHPLPLWCFFLFKFWIFTLLWIVNVTSPLWEAKKPTWGLKHENLRARKPIGIMGKLL